MKTNYKIIPTTNGKFQLEVDGKIIKILLTNINMETEKRELLEIIGEGLVPGEYRLEDGEIYGQYVGFYFLLSKVLLASMDENLKMFSDENFHWTISSDPFFHLVAGPESIDQREQIEFGLQMLEKAGGAYTDLPQNMAYNAQQMEEVRKSSDFYIDIKTAKIIRNFYIQLDEVRKGIFYHLWAATRWNVWIPLLWLNELCTDKEFCHGVAATQAHIPAFSDISMESYKEFLSMDLHILKECREFISLYNKKN